MRRYRPRALLTRFVTLLSEKLGRCPKCWRLSFRGAVIGWVAAGMVRLLWADALLWYLVLIWPISFSLLWLVHVGVFGARVVVWERTSVPPDGGDPLGATIGRRQMLRTFCRSAGWAVLVSAAVPLLAACGGGSSGGGGGGGGAKGSGCPCVSPNNTYCAAGTVATGCYSSCPSGCTQCFDYLNC